jgi:hypothetical protein
MYLPFLLVYVSSCSDELFLSFFRSFFRLSSSFSSMAFITITAATISLSYLEISVFFLERMEGEETEKGTDEKKKKE